MSDANEEIIQGNVSVVQEKEEGTQDSEISPDCEMIMGITGCDAAQAAQYLEMSGGNVDAAISLYFEMGSVPSLPPPSASSASSVDAQVGNPPAPPGGSSSSSDYFSSNALHYSYDDDDDDGDGDYRYEDDGSDGDEEDTDVNGLSTAFKDQMSMGRNTRGRRHDTGLSADIDDGYDVVRKPDSVKKMSLLGRTERGGSNWVSIEGNAVSSDSSKDPTIDWLYPMQEDISFRGNIMEVRHVAKGEKKWLLVNIQSHMEFDSHCLNRDTWTDENIREIISSNFIFWQRGHTTQDASVYMTRYNVEESNLPHISILDPRTGLNMLTITGFRSPDVMSELLLEFLDKHDIAALNHSASPLSCSPQLSGLLNTRLTPQQQLNFSGTPPTAATPETIFSRMQAAGGIAMKEDFVSFTNAAPSSSKVGDDETPNEYDPVKLYGDVPQEPNSSSPDTTRVQIKLPKGRIVRVYKKSDTVKCLYAVSAQDPQVEVRPFELLNTFPTVVVLTNLEQSLQDANVLNAQVTLRYK